jgi:hypothetical protein
MLEKRNTHRAVMENLERKRPLEDLGEDGRIIVKYILKKYAGREWNRLS